MALETEQRAWVARFLGNATPQELWDELPLADELKARNAVERRDIATARLAARAATAKKLEADHAGPLAEIAGLKMTVRSGMKEMEKEKPREVSLVGVDPTETYGHKFDIPTTQLEPKHIKIIGMADKGFMDEARRVEALTAPWSVLKGGAIVREERPLFDAMGVHDVVYAPFIRRGLFPEDQILAHFSKAQDMIDKSNRLYLEELAQVEDQPTWQDTTTQAQAVVSGLGAVVTASFGVSEAADANMHETAKTVGTIVAIVDASLKVTTIAVVEFSKKNAEDASKGILENLGAAIGKGIGGDTGKFVELGFKSAAQVPTLVKTLRTSATDGECASRLLAQLGDCIALGIDFGTVGKSGEASAKGAQISAIIKGSLVVVGKAFEHDLSGAIKAARRGDTAALKKFAIAYGAAVAKEVTVAVTTVMSVEVIQAKADKLDPAKNPNGYQGTPEYKSFLETDGGKKSGAEQEKAWKSYSGDVVSGWGNDDSALLSSQSGAADAALKALQSILDAKAVAASNSKMQEDLVNRDAIEYDEDSYIDELDALGKEPSKEALTRIGALIAKIQRQRAVMALIAGVVKTGSAGVARFWGAAAAAGTAMDLALQIKLAVETHRELVTWRQSSEYAANAASPYFTSVVSFVVEQERLYPRDVTKSIMLAVKMGAQIAQAEPTFGLAIGKLVESLATVAESAMDLICAQIDAGKVEYAWKITQAAFDDPENRKAALVARKLNPTLAKYTLAWGAMVAKDPVAKEACAEIGLTEGDLRAPADKADEAVKILVTYLEVRYARHLKVKKHRGEEEGTDLTWSKQVSIGTLVIEVWLGHVSTAVSKGMASQDPNKVGAALYDAWTAEQKFSDEVKKLYAISRDRSQHLTPEQVEKAHALADAYKKALANTQKALHGFKPVRASDRSTPDLDMEAVAELYLAHLDAEEMNVDMALSALDMAVERERLTGHGDDDLMRIAKETERVAAEALMTDSLGLLNEQLAAVKACNHTDETAALQAVFDAATAAHVKIGKRDLVSKHPAVSSVMKTLEEQLAPLGRLIASR